jgi:POT family proton-dependent oligopeptide transporter
VKTAETAPDTELDTGGWAGHPRGLSTLFFTEVWERFSYYGMRAFLFLYMTYPAAQGGLEFPIEKASLIYGSYTALVYFMSLPGGWLADRVFGQYRSVLFGGILIAMGHFTLTFPPLPCFFLGLSLIVLGTGLLKPNISAMVGCLYAEGDARRDAGFSIFYMGINIGSAVAPLVCGTLAQKVSWHLGFAAAGVGMLLGLVQYLAGRKRVLPALERLKPQRPVGLAQREPVFPLSRGEWMRVAAIGLLFVFSVVFWACFEQAGSSLTLFADRHTRPFYVFGTKSESSWYQSINAAFIVLLAPVFAALWVRLGPRNPTSPTKFTLGLIFVGLGFLPMVVASLLAREGQVSPLWLVLLYLLHTIGELCLSPVGLSATTKLAPARLVGFMMGIWFLSLSLGSYLGSWVAGKFEQIPLPQLFGSLLATAIGAAVVMALLIRPINRLSQGKA